MLSLLVVVASLLTSGLAQNQNLDMFGLINLLYIKADPNLDGVITSTELDAIYHGFDANGDGKVVPAEFVPLWSTITTFSQELANAYYILADLNADSVIDQQDLTALYARFDLDGDGSVTAQEFNLKWQSIYKEIPFAVLFFRVDANKDQYLNQHEFGQLFASLDTNKDGAVSKAELEAGWVAAKFGSKADADTLLSRLDTDHSNSLDSTDLDSLFPKSDLNHDHKIAVIEVVKLAGTPN